MGDCKFYGYPFADPQNLRMFYYAINFYTSILFQTIYFTSTHFREAWYEKSFIEKKVPGQVECALCIQKCKNEYISLR